MGVLKTVALLLLGITLLGCNESNSTSNPEDAANAEDSANAEDAANSEEAERARKARTALDKLIATVDQCMPETIQAVENYNTSVITDMSYLFSSTKIDAADVSLISLKKWDTSNVTSMRGMYLGHKEKDPVHPSFFDLNTSSVTDTANMLASVKKFMGDLSKMDFSSVIDDSAMVSGTQITAEQLPDTPNKPLYEAIITFDDPSKELISNYDTSEMTSFRCLFDGRHDIPDISQWVTINVTDMSGMFRSASDFNGDISGWQTGKVTDMSFMFVEAAAFNQDLSNWDVSNVNSMNSMFQKARSFDQSLNDWDTSNVTDMRLMFDHADVFNHSLGGWITSNVTDMHGMFSGAKAFNSDVSGWDTRKV